MIDLQCLFVCCLFCKSVWWTGTVDVSARKLDFVPLDKGFARKLVIALYMHPASLGGTSRKLDSESNWKAQQNDNFIVRISMHIMHAYRRSYAHMISITIRYYYHDINPPKHSHSKHINCKRQYSRPTKAILAGSYVYCEAQFCKEKMA